MEPSMPMGMLQIQPASSHQIQSMGPAQQRPDAAHEFWRPCADDGLATSVVIYELARVWSSRWRSDATTTTQSPEICALKAISRSRQRQIIQGATATGTEILKICGTVFELWSYLRWPCRWLKLLKKKESLYQMLSFGVQSLDVHAPLRRNVQGRFLLRMYKGTMHFYVAQGITLSTNLSPCPIFKRVIFRNWPNATRDIAHASALISALLKHETLQSMGLSRWNMFEQLVAPFLERKKRHST